MKNGISKMFLFGPINNSIEQPKANEQKKDDLFIEQHNQIHSAAPDMLYLVSVSGKFSKKGDFIYWAF